jgi:hypothetical protein
MGKFFNKREKRKETGKSLITIETFEKAQSLNVGFLILINSTTYIQPQLSEKRSIDSRQHSAISYQQKN